LDILRGLAIVLMTVYHQILPFGLGSTPIGRDLALITVFYTRPIFIAVSGIAIVFYERKYRCPFKMIVHGAALFTMSWCVDIVAHQSLRIDWDIFHLIGGCYVIAGLFNYVEKVGVRFLGILGLASIWFFFSGIRPDQGIFPIWPNGIYFLGGYMIGQWGISRYCRFWTTLLMFVGGVIYLLIFHLFYELPPKLAYSLLGLAASYAAIFSLLFLTLLLENRGRSEKFPLALLVRFGRYPVSLYYLQQFFTVFGIKGYFKLAPTGISNIDCIMQTTSLLIGMYLLTYVFDRIKFLSVESWIRKAESIIMNYVPPDGIFGPLPIKKVF
jgi:hypothetical protein